MTGERVIKLRTRAGLSQRGLANLMRVTQATVYRWEVGKVTPTGPALTLLQVLELVLRVSG